MPKEKSAPKVVRWYARDKKDVARLEAMGATTARIYLAEKGQTPGKFVMRKGERLGIVDGYRAFGSHRRLFAPVVDLIHSWGAYITDVETGRDSQTQNSLMFNEGVDPPKPSPELLAKMRAERSAAWRLKNGVMSKRDALIIWRDPSLTVKDALALMHGWKKSQAYDELGIRDVPTGRPKKQRAA